jgi:hypothetical protein
MVDVPALDTVTMRGKTVTIGTIGHDVKLDPTKVYCSGRVGAPDEGEKKLPLNISKSIQTSKRC